jgi:quercetin dioxygenase-like cupin family protein
MEEENFDEAITFNLSNIIDYKSNDILVKNIVIRNTVIIQYLLFDFGKVQVYKKSPFLRFIYIVEGKAEVVINKNSTFLQKGDSILIPGNEESSIEANQPFKMLCTTIKKNRNL